MKKILACALFAIAESGATALTNNAQAKIFFMVKILLFKIKKNRLYRVQIFLSF